MRIESEILINRIDSVFKYKMLIYIYKDARKDNLDNNFDNYCPCEIIGFLHLIDLYFKGVAIVIFVH